MKTFMILIFIFIVTLPAFGDGLDRPNFRNPPTQYIYKHIVQDAIGEKVDTEDELLIGDRDDQKLTFWFYITAKNFHVCCMTGIATAIKKNEYVFTEGNCNLIIKIKGQEVQLFDPNDKCKKSYCGMYAFINGVKFTKTK
jgi:hypothetical protein